MGDASKSVFGWVAVSINAIAESMEIADCFNTGFGTKYDAKIDTKKNKNKNILPLDNAFLIIGALKCACS